MPLVFKDISGADIRAIQVPVLIINGDSDVVRAEHAESCRAPCRMRS